MKRVVASMTNAKWPSFEIADLGESATDEAEFTRRWEAYRDQMRPDRQRIHPQGRRRLVDRDGDGHPYWARS